MFQKVFDLISMGSHYMIEMPKQNSRRRQAFAQVDNVQGKIVIITGSNSGLGKQAALELAKRGCHVVMACRDLKSGEEARQEIFNQVPQAIVDLLELDLSDLASVRSFADQVTQKYPHINILINNAGVVLQKVTQTKEGFETNLGVNHLGPFLLTMLLLNHLKKGSPSRIICVSSMSSLLSKLKMDDLMLERRGAGFLQLLPYANSKLANALFVKELARKLDEMKVDGINLYALCPGVVKSNLYKHTQGSYKLVHAIGMALVGMDVKKGTETILYCALNSELVKESGHFYRFLGRWEEPEKKMNDKLARDLWVKSEELVRLPPFSKESFLSIVE